MRLCVFDGIELGRLLDCNEKERQHWLSNSAVAAFHVMMRYQQFAGLTAIGRSGDFDFTTTRPRSSQHLPATHHEAKMPIFFCLARQVGVLRTP